MRLEPRSTAGTTTADPTGAIAPHRPYQLSRLQAALDAATPAAPFDIAVIGDSQASISRPHYTGQRPWPVLLADLFGGQNSTWVYGSAPPADYPTMTSTGTDTAAAVAGFGTVLDPGEYATLDITNCTRLRIWWTGGTGTIQVRNGAVGGPLLATINTNTGDTETSHYTDLTVGVELPVVFLGVYFGTLYLVGAGAPVTVEAASFATNCPVRITNIAHGGWSTQTWLSNPERYATALARMAPELVIVATGTNDDPANIGQRLTDMIGAIRAATPSSSVLLLGPAKSNGFTVAEITTVRDVATAQQVPLLALSSLLPNGILSTDRLSSDELHWSRLGHQAVARWVHAAIVGDAASRAWANTVLAAQETAYTPATAGHWPAEPWSIRAALDALASRVDALEP